MTQSTSSNEKLHNGVRTVSEEKLMVVVRVRPLRNDEGPRIVHVVSDKMLVLEEEADSRRDVLRQRRVNDKHYIYDKVFGEESTQEEVYATVCSPLVADALRGIAGAVFAYGATGAGKTHTMTGLMARALSHLFESIADSDDPDAYEVMRYWRGRSTWCQHTTYNDINATHPHHTHNGYGIDLIMD
ncbi:Kinesin-like protein KIF19 [Papilio xuthus]|uniref:Kinesin-like protein KIF19 n=1 Tax=Papilio xuthus TaxID=66420 RepID=A0A194QBE8_PAPXU|nr:Kinesin-like protein KIF19 [Papilio xuthus]